MRKAEVFLLVVDVVAGHIECEGFAWASYEVICLSLPKYHATRETPVCRTEQLSKFNAYRELRGVRVEHQLSTAKS